MKRSRLGRTMILVLAVVMVFAFATTAFATGEDLSHSGYSSYGYYTSDYFSQKNDNRIYCTYAYASRSGMQVYPVYYNSGWIRMTSNVSFSTGYKFYVQDWSYVRHIHLRLVNTGSAYGVSTYTSGVWDLRP